ncbi:FadR/GntR family transcriptional regulator [Paracoccus isoporae]|nr:FadR/GntR family transcriptional regulator [Paracoccus isoporae]
MMTPRRSLADVVFERMELSIKSGAYADDERLPTEHELAAEFEVSRPIVREALRRLRERGLIYSRQGAGSFVRTLGLRNPLGYGALENIADLLSCYEFRAAIEPSSAALAAARHTEDSLAAIVAALTVMKESGNRQAQREDADFQFHLAIAVASDNSYYSTTLAAMKDHIGAGMKLSGLSAMRANASGPISDEHDRIVEAIRNRDEEAASLAMRDHLNGSRERLFERRRPDPVSNGVI